MYYAVINQWNNYLYHVMANIGGIYIENTTVGDGEKTYTFVEKEKQQAALRFLLDEVLCYPKWLFDPEIAQYTYLLKNTPLGVVENAPTQVLKNAQAYVFWDLLSNNRLIRMLRMNRKYGLSETHKNSVHGEPPCDQYVPNDVHGHHNYKSVSEGRTRSDYQSISC